MTSSKFFDYDMKKLMSEFKVPDFNVPSVDVDSIVDAQKKNVEAISEASQMAFEGAQAVMKRQGELAHKAMEEITSAVKDLSETSSPQEGITKQADVTKDALDRSLSNVSELTDMMTKSNQAVFDLLSKRINQVIEEYKDMIDDTQEKASAPKTSGCAAKKAPAKKSAAKKSTSKKK
ncbi:MAG: phasin family protein [Alphaproteobacteria bacterium]|nr:phasin family protein [Alphaproteobacteria bacterium]